MKASTLFALAFALAIAFLLGFQCGLRIQDNGRPNPPMKPISKHHIDNPPGEILEILPGKEKEQILLGEPGQLENVY